jgi:hypothetical protein
VTGWWFSPGPTVSSTDKTDHHDITEMLLKVTLNTIKQTNVVEFSYLLISFLPFSPLNPFGPMSPFIPLVPSIPLTPLYHMVIQISINLILNVAL